MFSVPPSLHRVPPGSVPRLRRYDEALRLLPAHPLAFGCPRLPVPAPEVLFAPTDRPSVTVRRPGPGLRWASRGCSLQETRRSPRFLGEPCTLAPLYDPGRAYPSGVSTDTLLPAANKKASARTTNLFRGSITRLACSLSTLHHERSLVAAQDSLPAGAPLLGWAGLSPAGSL